MYRLKYTNPCFEMPTIKTVDFRSTESWALLPSNMSGDLNWIYCAVTTICVFRFVYTLLLRRNSELKKISSDSESNSFANLWRIFDEDIDFVEEDEQDIEESLTHKLTSRVDVKWRFGGAIQMKFSKVK